MKEKMNKPLKKNDESSAIFNSKFGKYDNILSRLLFYCLHEQ